MDRKIIIYLVFLIGVIVGFSSFMVYSSKSASMDKISIAIVNVQRIRDEAKAFRQLSILIDEQHSNAHKKIMEMEAKLRKEHEKIKEDEQKNKKNSPELLQKRQIFEKQVADLEQKVQSERDSLNSQFIQLEKQIESSMQSVLSEVVYEKKIQIVINTNVLDKEVILSADKKLNITDEVIKRLDIKLPNVSLKSD
jgi:Skp family chaperone for outer membrane proteins